MVFGTEGPVKLDDKGLAFGPCITAKCEMEDGFSTKLMGPNWHQYKLYPFGEPNPDAITDFGWISAAQVRQEALKAEVGIVWS